MRLRTNSWGDLGSENLKSENDERTTGGQDIEGAKKPQNQEPREGLDYRGFDEVGYGFFAVVCRCQRNKERTRIFWGRS